MEYYQLIGIAESAYAEAKRRAGDWIVCQPGCDLCCHKPFAITPADAARLRDGLAGLDDAVARAIVERAEVVRTAFATGFPGDLASGTLTDNAEWREWFFARHYDVPCPALDPNSRKCLLYDHRPIACRIYGPLIQIGEQTSDPCSLCFSGATASEVEATRVKVDLPEAPAVRGDTLIAFALTGPPR